ncbi:protein PHYLLO, chloroplastic-like isoform X1 [Papaver somniferum]|uniref:protein PHYLLO, chloroplastic-like isoform X1 n=1 Tax=Papaver somniferum TaxID=3469 RepID=UPI000E6FD4CA|nr:protein PHYLLO, chloroplastic-like isoform X1 [Papaver somniferum]
MKEVTLTTLQNPFSTPRYSAILQTKRKTYLPTSILLPFLNNQSLPTNSQLLLYHRNPNFKFVARVISGKGVETGLYSSSMEAGGDDDDEEEEDSELPVELSYTRTLPPALTFEHGIKKIKVEIDKLKLNSPTSRSGILRFQVAVPPSTKACNWLCNQPQTPEVFPQFYLSKMDVDKEGVDLHLPNGLLGVSGVGAAAQFTCKTTDASKERSSIKRYLSVASPLIKAYGFVGIHFDTESYKMRRENGSSYYFIPQLELDEYGSTSLLAATLAWDYSSPRSFNEAMRSLELSLDQVVSGLSISDENCQNKFVSSDLTQANLVDDKMVRVNVNSLVEEVTAANRLQLERAQSSSQFYFRLSPTIEFTGNMLDRPGERSYSLQKSANINAVWATLIIEECCRLGLTYFCIAPGSRSSPLAVAASTHPLTTCISCYDERSLAFHALGYAKGSTKPAVVITSSGTAVSNLFPAVVEASQNFVPLLLLTADRPPELLDAGANQAINQVNHFGSFVRYFFNLPPPTDDIPARMVLTTLDSAVHWATHAPYGPVHINCAFREPLENTPKQWRLSCLQGLDLWKSSTEPFTKYIEMHHSCIQMDEVVNLIQCANKGLLIIGALQTENEMWEALLLAKHLSWPIVADILSGLRFRKVLTSFPEIDEKLLFIDHLDHALLSDSVRSWAHADMIIQIGSRITSKCISKMIEVCAPCPYIVVDKHPFRHDPSHIVTHRIQSSISAFADCLLNVDIPRMMTSKWRDCLQALNTMVAREIEFQIRSECSLTEPHVARIISEALPSDAALFIGNSMVVRDAEMYGCGWTKPAIDVETVRSDWELPCLGIQVAGNRGASGIDGLLSTAVGFAAGCNKRVFCVVGDISFLYDTNGLAILNHKSRRKPMTIVVTNNHGGAIFSLLPIANVTEPSVLNQFFYTSHNTSIGKLCEAHSVRHLQVRTKMELREALMIAEQEQTDCLIEVESNIEDNAKFHRTLSEYACQVADHTFHNLSRLSSLDHISSGFFLCRIHQMDYSLYRIQLSAPPTSTPLSDKASVFHREGFLISLYLDDGTAGFGEIAPLEIHKESMLDVEEQLRFLLHTIKGVKISYLLPLLNGSFSSWIWEQFGIPPTSISPSVRCGLEMAILNAIAAREGCSFSDLLLSHESATPKSKLLETETTVNRMPRIHICALLDSNGTPEEVAHIAGKLVEEGFTAIKLKVARRGNPLEDGAVIQEVRKRVGDQIKLRVDANRKWTYEEACQFAATVKFCDLQYIEEPVQLEDDIIKFCEESSLPVAIDESVDNIQGDLLTGLEKFTHRGIVAVVIKPSVVGGFEYAALIAKWAQQQNKMAVVSAAFESSLSLSTYAQFSHYLEVQNMEICRVKKNKELHEPIAHGLGTYKWLKEDVTSEPLKILGRPYSDTVAASLKDSAIALQKFKIDPKIVQRSYSREQVKTYELKVDHENYSCSFKVHETGIETNNNVLVFLHGFLGTSGDWISIMKPFSSTARCISIDLPGHGGSKVHNHGNNKANQDSLISTEVISNLLSKLIHKLTNTRVVIIGYSMGARIALQMALRCNNQINGAVIISGSPGIKDDERRRSRRAQDDAKARFLTEHGLQFFLETWYTGALWKSLRDHPNFKQIISSRMQHDDVHSLATSLSDLSTGRQPSLWEELKHCKKPLLFVVGEKDKKFKKIAQEMCHEISLIPDNNSKETPQMVEVPDCGHAVHLENPLPLISAISQFWRKLD